MKGYIEQGRITENYLLGLKTLRLSQLYKEQMGLVKQARAALETLSRKLDETVYTGVVREQSVVCLGAVETSQTLRVATRIGSRLAHTLLRHRESSACLEMRAGAEISKRWGFSKID